MAAAPVPPPSLLPTIPNSSPNWASEMHVPCGRRKLSGASQMPRHVVITGGIGTGKRTAALILTQARPPSLLPSAPPPLGPRR